MQFDIHAILEFIIKNKLPFIIGGVVVWLVLLVVISIGVASGGKSADYERLAERERYYNEQLKAQAKIDERLMSRGQILASKDNTPIEMIRVYSMRADRPIELSNDADTDAAFAPLVPSTTNARTPLVEPNEYSRVESDSVIRGRMRTNFNAPTENFYDATLP